MTTIIAGLVVHPGFEPLARTRCDDDGRYRLRLAPGAHSVRVRVIHTATRMTT